MQGNGSNSCSCGLTAKGSGSLWSPAIEELVAIGAAVGCNCIPCLKYHIDKARELGVSDEDMVSAVAIGSKVKQRPAQLILEQADRQLGGRVAVTVDPQASCATPRAAQSKCCG